MSDEKDLSKLLPGPELLALAEGIARGEYNLLLGAGASKGGSGAGRPLPVGGELAEQITEDFSLPAEGHTLSLADAYEAAVTRRDGQDRTLPEYIKARFTSCTPPSWHNVLPSLSWRRIWTLNIDDTIESAYESHVSPRQQPRPISWYDRHTDPDPEELQIIHLHGRATEPARIVFSIAEYLNTTTAQHAWHRVFGDHFQEKPFLIIGASLRGEFDLANVIRRGSQSKRLTGRPSYIVARDLPILQREFAEKAGLVPIPMTGEPFLSALMPHIRSAERALKELTAVRGAILPREAQIFLEQFGPLKVDALNPRKLRDFYLGYDPSWPDILMERDAVFEVVESVGKSLLALREKKTATQRLELIRGPWGTGKSTALLRIGRELIRHGEEIYLFRGDSTLDAESAAWWLNRRPNTTLLFDGVADVASELETLLQACKQANLRAHVVGVERQQRMRTVRSALSAEFLNTEGPRVMRLLSDTDIRTLIKTLKEHSRLGKITRWGDSAQFLYFVRDSGRQLFTAMSELEGGPGFLERLTREFEKDDVPVAQRDLLSLCGFSSLFGYPLPVGVAAHITGMNSDAILDAVDTGPISEWIDPSRHGLRLRHRRIATLLIEKVLGPADRYRLSQQLALSLAPRVTPNAIYNRTLPYLIVRNILDAENVYRWVGGEVSQWYTDLHREYSWNARYWEQRALAHLLLGDQATARSYGEKAVDVHRDPMTQTTLGHIILKQLITALEGGAPFRLEEFQQASTLLTSARATSRDHDDFPYTVFFEGTLRIMRLLKRRGETFSEVSKEFQEWLDGVERSPLSEFPEYSRLVSRVKREFLRLAQEGRSYV